MDTQKLKELAKKSGIEEKLSFIDSYTLIENEYYIAKVENEECPIFFTFYSKIGQEVNITVLRFEYEVAKGAFENVRYYNNKQSKIDYLMTHAPLYFRKYYAKTADNSIDKKAQDVMTRVIKDCIRGNDYDIVKSIKNLCEMALKDEPLKTI